MVRGDREVELEGVIVHSRDYAESHRVLGVLTPTHGRVTVFARGGRASRRRFRGALDLFVSLHMQCTPSRDAWTLRAADIIDARTGLRRSLEQLQRATLLAECAAVLSAEEAATPGLYESLSRGLDHCTEGALEAAVAALPRMVVAAGLGLDTSACVRCGRTLGECGALEGGQGLVCSHCRPDAAHVPVAALRGELEELSAAEARALEETLAVWIEAQTGKKLRSRGIL